MKKPRCPHCGRPPVKYHELWHEHYIVFDADDDGTASHTGELADGDPYAVEAHCCCGHVWRLRGVRQITSVQAD